MEICAQANNCQRIFKCCSYMENKCMANMCGCVGIWVCVCVCVVEEQTANRKCQVDIIIIYDMRIWKFNEARSGGSSHTCVCVSIKKKNIMGTRRDPVLSLNK